MTVTKKSSSKSFAAVILFLFLNLPLSIGAADLDIFAAKRDVHPKMESVLSKLVEEHTEAVIRAQKFASQQVLQIEEINRITVFIFFKDAESVDSKSLEAYGAEIIKSAGNVIKAKVPISALRLIADEIEGISFIKTPDKAAPQVTQSEGTDLTGAVTYHLAGFRGSGSKIAVIDVGFANLSSAIAGGELPHTLIAADCTASGCSETTFPLETEPHGTAVAEIIHDIVPEAQLYLLKISDSLDLLDAKNYCVANGIKIINHSLNFFNANFYDGICYYWNPVCTADDAYLQGILWVNSIGNYAQQHYEDTFTDTDSNGWHNVSASNEFISLMASAGDEIKIFMTWNAWPVTDQDYDMCLLDDTLNLVTCSLNPQNGAQPPIEAISYIAPRSGLYHVALNKWSATADHHIEVYSWNHVLTPSVASSSLLNPADAIGVFAAGAIDYRNWLTGPITDYSSQGPTNDGRIKPEIVAPDSVSTYSYGINNFPGTSASAPHVAGLAALILSANPTFTVSDLWNMLTGSALDIGIAGQDNVYGFGRLNIPELSGKRILGTIGTRFTISGRGFGTQKPRVYLEDVAMTRKNAKVESWSDTFLTCLWTKKLHAGTYNLMVQPRGDASPISIGQFTVLNPLIQNVTPETGAPGDVITISGKYFSSNKPGIYIENAETFARKKCKVLSSTMDAQSGDSLLQFVIPDLSSGVYNILIKNKIGETRTVFHIQD
ncbi:MAG: S8 family serine peptidase [Nitrospirota bacterium]